MAERTRTAGQADAGETALGAAGPDDAAFDALVASCVVVDFETEDDRIRDVGAIRGEQVFRLRDTDSSGDALDRLGEFGRGARFLVGHNVVAHDRRFAEIHRPDAELLNLPLVDTLYLAPLAFPQRPYHALVKDYKLAGERSDPIDDCRISLKVLGDCWHALKDRERKRLGLVSIYRSCFDDSDVPGGTSALRFNGTGEVLRGFEHFAADRACLRAVRRELLALFDDAATRPAVAYALAWLTVSGTESVLARWVHHSFPGTSSLLRAIRGVDCGDADCEYCREQHDSGAKLREYFGHPGFRSRPATSDGESLQARVVERGLAGAPLLAIMPTGGGKSLCYQLPAIVHNERTGALTVVISPLQALMKDQVENLNREIRGGKLAAALNGLMTLPERHDVLEGVRLGRFALLYVSPEQLRNGSFETAVRQREIASWVFDEGHCISKWGHDFRPDYLYAARFIREFSAREGVAAAPVACFTATARLDVREEIAGHFRKELGQELEVIAADRVDRTNLRYAVEQVVEAQKVGRIAELLERSLAEAFVLAEHERVEGELAFERAVQAAWARLFPGQLRVAAGTSVADTADRFALVVDRDCGDCRRTVRAYLKVAVPVDFYVRGAVDDGDLRAWASAHGVEASDVLGGRVTVNHGNAGAVRGAPGGVGGTARRGGRAGPGPPGRPRRAAAPRSPDPVLRRARAACSRPSRSGTRPRPGRDAFRGRSRRGFSGVARRQRRATAQKRRPGLPRERWMAGRPAADARTRRPPRAVAGLRAGRGAGRGFRRAHRRGRRPIKVRAYLPGSTWRCRLFEVA